MISFETLGSSFDPIDHHLTRLSSRNQLTCEPVSILLGATALASAGGATSSIIGQNTNRQLAKHYEDEKRNAQDTVILENRMRSTKAYLKNVRLEQLRQSQEESALAEQGGDIAKQAAGASSKAVASAAERGVAGNSLETILGDYAYQQDQSQNAARHECWPPTCEGSSLNGLHGNRDFSGPRRDSREAIRRPLGPL